MIMNSVERRRSGTNVLYRPRSDDELVPKRTGQRRTSTPIRFASSKSLQVSFTSGSFGNSTDTSNSKMNRRAFGLGMTSSKA